MLLELSSSGKFAHFISMRTYTAVHGSVPDLFRSRFDSEEVAAIQH